MKVASQLLVKIAGIAYRRMINTTEGKLTSISTIKANLRESFHHPM